MEFTAREDVDIPIEKAFALLTEVGVFERAALRRGAEVTRLDSLPQAGVGSSWDIAFSFRGKDRTLRLNITGMDAPNEVDLHAVIKGLTTDIKLELVALSRSKTRIQLWTGSRAKSLSARLVLQSLKLARSSINSRIAARMTNLREDLEARHAQRS